MVLHRRGVMAGAAGLALTGRPARAQPASVKIGVLADFSGLYVDLLGMPGVECARQAVADFAAHGVTADIVYADHQNKPDVGTTIARRWFDTEGVDMLVAGPNSAVELAVSAVAREKNKACCGVAVTASEFTGAQCTPNEINWTYDAYMLSKAIAAETVKSGGKTWFFLSTDNSFGASLQAETSRFIEQAGGRVLGGVKCPLATTDFSSMLLQAKASGADVLALAVGGSDTINAVKQAQEFGLSSQMKMAALVIFLSDIHSAGLGVMQGLLFTNSFYWDLNERTRAFTRRVLPRLGGTYPGMTQAGCYAVTTHYLKAVAAMGVAKAKASGADAIAQMKAMPTDDDAFGPGSIRADGRAVIPAYLLQVKTPAESRQDWDYCKLVSTLAPAQTVRPLNEGGCPLVKS